LYELEVVEEEVFFQWEQDESRLTDSKEVVMVRGARDFLKWLREAEE
jgi:hypothetical protein